MSLAEFDAFVKEHFGKLRPQQGMGLRVLSERSSSPTLERLKRALPRALPARQVGVYEPAAARRRARRFACSRSAGRTARSTARGREGRSSRSTPTSSPPISRGHSRTPEASTRGRVPDGEMSRIYAVESSYSLTGGLADHRLPLRAELIKAFAVALDAEVSRLAQRAARARFGASRARSARS